MEYVICHHGIKGQKWGIRRYQNKDGSLTPAGEKRLEKYKSKELEAIRNKYQVDKLKARRDKFEEDFIKNYDTRSMARLTRARYRHLKAQSMEFIEKSKIESMTFDEMQSERAELSRMKGEKFVNGLGRTVVSKIVGESSGGLWIDSDVAKTNMRVGLEESIYAEYEARKNSGYKGL